MPRKSREVINTRFLSNLLLGDLAVASGEEGGGLVGGADGSALLGVGPGLGFGF